jgi:DNA replication protein DnaC
MEQIDAILRKISDRGLFMGVRRYSYEPYQLDYSLQVIEHIGKKRSPKFVIDDENRFVYENLARWIHGDMQMMCVDPVTKALKPGRLNAGIYLAGNTGSGKSWALEVMSAYTLLDNVQIDLGGKRRCLCWDNVRAGTICDDYARDGSIERYKRAAILGIQDLGAEPSESLFMGNRMNVLRQVIEHRGDNPECLTMISSNLPMTHKILADRYGDRVVSRLQEMCNYFELRGKDRRLM